MEKSEAEHLHSRLIRFEVKFAWCNVCCSNVIAHDINRLLCAFSIHVCSVTPSPPLNSSICSFVPKSIYAHNFNNSELSSLYNYVTWAWYYDPNDGIFDFYDCSQRWKFYPSIGTRGVPR